MVYEDSYFNYFHQLMLFLFLFFRYSLQGSNRFNITLKPNEKKVIDLTGLLIIYINSFQHSTDDITFRHNKNGLISEFNPSNHLAFREGSLEIFSKNGASFPVWLLSSESCPVNNYVIEPSQMTMLHFFLDSTPQFCIFTHFNFPFSALILDSTDNLSSNVKLLKSDWIPIMQRKTYSVSEPFLLQGKAQGRSFGDVSIVYTVGNGKCNIAQIKENNQDWPEINILCQNITRKFNMWLWGFVIFLGFTLTAFVLIYFGIINLRKYWNPSRIPGNRFANRVEEHLEIEESLEGNSQVDVTAETNNQQQPPHDAL